LALYLKKQTPNNLLLIINYGVSNDGGSLASRGVARNLIWVGINVNYSHCKETKQPHKKFKVDWFGGYISRYTPQSLRPCSPHRSLRPFRPFRQLRCVLCVRCVGWKPRFSPPVLGRRSAGCWVYRLARVSSACLTPRHSSSSVATSSSVLPKHGERGKKTSR